MIDEPWAPIRPVSDEDMWATMDALPAASDTTRPGSWRPVDLRPILDGTQQPLTASVGSRSDGAGLFYRGRQHTVASESEGGKTWLLLGQVVVELARGNSAMVVDFEDSEVLSLAAGFAE